MTDNITNYGAPASDAPTLEEQYASLKAEGYLSDDVDGALVDVNTDAQGGADGEQEGADQDRPSWLPERFTSVEEYTTYVADLEKKAGGKDDSAADDDGSAEATPEERAAAEEATARAGLKLEEVSQEFLANKGLKDETYEKLSKAGYPREMVDIYIEGLTARTTATSTQAYAIVGSEAEYGSMIDWAIENLSDGEQAAFDEAINSNNPSKALLAIKGMNASYKAAKAKVTSQEPESPLSPRGAPTGSVYRHLDDYMADLNDPRYDKSETFRQSVMQKLGRSPNI